MAFRFPLATVLRFRESIEKREELALQKLLLESARIRRELDRLAEEIAKAQETRSKAMLQPLAAVHIQMMLNAIDSLADRRKTLTASLEAVEQERARQTQKYQAAHRDRLMLSDMCDRHRDAYEQERARAQQKMLDDLFAARAQRG
jgi:flagellar export protein FliJ